MPRRALRPNRSERDLKRRSTFNPTDLFKWSDKAADQPAEHHAPSRFAVSEDGGRPRRSDVDVGLGSRPSELPPQLPPTPPIQEHTPNTHRFSLMRFRHASDPQLSLKAREHAVDEEPPPVPQVPAATPAIITTAPTMHEHDEPQAVQRKRSLMHQFSLRRRSFEPHSSERPTLRKSMDKTSTDMKRHHPFAFMKSRDTLHEEPGRLSKTHRPETHPQPAKSASDAAQEGTSTLSLPVPRPSESSPSDESSGGHVSFEVTPRPRAPPKSSSARFAFGRRNKQRAPLFPLPPKVEPPQFPNTAPATPRVSTSNANPGDPPRRSIAGDQPSLPASNNARLHALDGADTPPLPSPSQVALAAASMNLATPGASGLIRSDSTRSIRSAQSSPNASPMRLALRGRSSTMGSLGGRSDHASPTPPHVASGRTSTSAPRTSLSNLFGLGARFRQNSEPYSPRHPSPAHAYTGSPGFTPLQNSVNISREALVAPEREEGETAGHYLERLDAQNSDKSAIAGYLSKNADDFSQAVLRSYMRKFAFYGDPLDMAIRKLLMQVELPKESQQIDRLLQRFADRYHECNPGIFVNPDNAHFVSFSIMMLHTDYFNPNNKRKMQRAEYIRNVEGSGISEDVLGCFYENIVYTPFIRIEDEDDQKNKARKHKRTALLKAPIAPLADPDKKEPLDPYTLILQGKLDILRPNIKEVMNVDDPYTYLGTAPSLDIRNLYKSFARYGVIQIVSSRSRPEAFMSQNSQENPLDSSVGIVEMPVSKVGTLWRKNMKKKKTRSPWQEWGAVLTRSGLSLFRDPHWAKQLIHQHDQHQKQGDGGAVVFQPPVPDFNPQTMIPMGGAVALVDNTYKKHKNAFVMLSKLGEEVFLTNSEKDLNDWLGMLNYSAAFETMGVRPRGMIGGLYEGQRNRGIRRLESSHSTTSVSTPTGEVTIQSGKIDKQFAQQMMERRQESMQMRISDAEETLARSIKDLEDRLRDARHMQVLAPIQPKTRDALIHAAGRLSAKLKWSRQEIWRMKCHRDILAQELEDEKQSVNDRQARIDQINETSQLSQPPPTSQPTYKPSKLSSLARLSSKASSLTGSHKPPLSPTASLVRPGTKSSQNTEIGGDDNFKTPPETRQTSPNHPSGTFSPHPLNPQMSNQSSHRRPSVTSSVAQSPGLAPKEHRPSISTIDDHALTSDGASDMSHYTTPPHTGTERSEPRTPELAPMQGPRTELESESEAERPAGLAGSPASRSKVRRSLHRTLRDPQSGSSHRRSQRGRDSASTIVSDDTQGSEGLARGQGSFTVHGKKASVITFGLDWNNMPPEERLKGLQQAKEPAAGGGSPVDEKVVNAAERSLSITSASTVDLSPPAPISEADETTPRPSNETAKQRQVSSQTITPASVREPVNGHTSDPDAKSEMSGIAEETTKDLEDKKKDTTADEKNKVERVEESVSSPKPQAVEA